MSCFIHLTCHVVKFLIEFNPPHALSETIYSGMHIWSEEWNLVGLLVQQNPVNVKFINPKSLLINMSPNSPHTFKIVLQDLTSQNCICY